MAREWTTLPRRIDFNHSVSFPTTGSISLWVKPKFDQNDGLTHRFFQVFKDGSNIFNVAKDNFPTANDLRVLWYTSATTYTAAAGTYTLTENEWNHILATWDDSANEMYLYLNGSQIGSNTTSLVTFDSTGIQYRFGDGVFNASAIIAECSIWNRVLSAPEIAASAAGVSQFPFGQTDYFPLWGTHETEPNLIGGQPSSLLVDATIIRADHAPVVPLELFDPSMVVVVAGAPATVTGFIPYNPIRAPIQNVIYDPTAVGRA